MTLSAQHLPILIHQMLQECILSCAAVAIGLVKETEEKTTLNYDAVRWKDRVFLLLLFLLKHHVFRVTNKTVVWF